MTVKEMSLMKECIIKIPNHGWESVGNDSEEIEESNNEDDWMNKLLDHGWESVGDDSEGDEEGNDAND